MKHVVIQLYKKANEIVTNQKDTNFKKFINKLNDNDIDTIRDRLADFFVSE